MNAIVNFLERYIVPVAARIGSQRHLMAIRDAFIAMMPITMAGAFAVFLNALFRDMPRHFFGHENVITDFWPIEQLIGINGAVWNGTLAIIALCLAVTLGYTLAESKGNSGVAGSLIALAAYTFGVPAAAATTTNIALQTALPASVAAELAAHGSVTVAADGLSLVVTGGAWGFFEFSQFFNPQGIFAVMVTTLISVGVFNFMMGKNITIKMSDSVPPMVSRAFSSLIPAITSLFCMALLFHAWGQFMDGEPFTLWIMRIIGDPLLNLSQGYLAVFVMILMVHVLWFFGLHGTNILAPVFQSVYGVAQTFNMEAYEMGYRGADLPFRWTASSFEAFVWPGGAGASLVMVVAILVFAKRSDYRAVGKLGVGPAIFNINEPLMFGLPVVLNPLMFIPFILAPLATGTIAFWVTHFELVNPMAVSIPWVMPTILSGLIGSAFDFRTIILSVVNLAVAFVIWAPFVIAANRMEGSDAA